MTTTQHTMEDDFQHFLAYSSLSGEPADVIGKLRKAFEANWSAQPAPIQSAELAELRRRAEAATSGEWVQPNKKVPYVKSLGVDSYLLHTMPIGEEAKDFHPDTRARWLKDAAFIAAANPAAIVKLLNTLDMVQSLYEGAHADRMALATPAQPIETPNTAPNANWTALEEIAYYDGGSMYEGSVMRRIAQSALEADAELVKAAQPIADVSAPKLPNGWVALSIVFDEEADYPEEVAYGPTAMMARLGKKLDKYYAGVIAARDARAADASAPTDEGQQGTLSIERIVRNAILGNSHPCIDGYVMFISSDEVDTVAAQVGLAARAAAPVSGPSDA